MKNNKSILDIFLENRIKENKTVLSDNLNESILKEQACLEQICQSIKHCKKKIESCDRMKCGSDFASFRKLELRRAALVDNLNIWNTMGHIQMASIEIKESIKRLSSVELDEWEKQDIVETAYVSIYETSKNLVDSTGKLIVFLKNYFPAIESDEFKTIRKELTTFREKHSFELKNVRNSIAAHRNEDVLVQVRTMSEIHISEAIQLITEYGNIVNELGTVTSPLCQLGICRLEATK